MAKKHSILKKWQASITKSTIFSTFSKVFDPAGVFSPVVLPAKQIYQALKYLERHKIVDTEHPNTVSLEKIIKKEGWAK